MASQLFKPNETVVTWSEMASELERTLEHRANDYPEFVKHGIYSPITCALYQGRLQAVRLLMFKLDRLRNDLPEEFSQEIFSCIKVDLDEF